MKLEEIVKNMVYATPLRQCVDILGEYEASSETFSYFDALVVFNLCARVYACGALQNEYLGCE